MSVGGAAGGRRLNAILWASFKQLHGGLMSAVGVGFGFLAWLWKPDVGVPLAYVAVGAVLSLTVILVLIDALVETHRMVAQGPPLVVAVKREVPPNLVGEALIVLNASDLYTPGLSVTIHLIEDEMERCVGIGRVASRQADGRVQVLVLLVYGDPVAEVEALRRNLRHILVKPHMNDADVESMVARKGGPLTAPTGATSRREGDP